MCGICGKLIFGDEIIHKELLIEMAEVIAYRGPDDEGYYINHIINPRPISIGLAHRRLSIIDLSDAGKQPMSNEDGSIWLIYNGEIYNFMELKEELIKSGHIFKSNTDSEVIIHLYEQEGLNCINRLNGMFAFALWDEKRARLWLARDRIGIKPLLYYWDGGQFVFGSEIKSILKDPSVRRSLNPEALHLYLAFNYIPAPLSIFQEIKKLKPGTYIIVENGKLRESTYWDVQPDPDEYLNRESSKISDELKRDLFETLSDAVKIRLISDVPLGAFLSGGIDSSIVVALMSRHRAESVKTFSIGFKDDRLFDETAYAREVSKRFKTDHTEILLTYKDMLDVFEEVIDTFDEPFADSSAIPTYIVSRETKRFVKVALSGDGGDELFAGYRSYLSEIWRKRYFMVPGFLRENIIEKIIESFPDSRDVRILEYIRRVKKFIRATRGDFPSRILHLKEILPYEVRKRIIKDGYGSNRDDPALIWIKKRLRPWPHDPLTTILYIDLKDSLPGDMLNKVDWMSMKNSLEVRVPILDHRVVELSFKIGGSIKIYRGITKYILKETFKDILPQEIYRRPKSGFEIPISRWLKGELKFLINNYLSRERICDQNIFDYNIITSLIKNLMSGKTDTSWMIWNLIVFQHWYEKYL